MGAYTAVRRTQALQHLLQYPKQKHLSTPNITIVTPIDRLQDSISGTSAGRENIERFIAVPIIVEPSCRGRPACRPAQNLKMGGHIAPPLQ